MASKNNQPSEHYDKEASSLNVENNVADQEVLPAPHQESYTGNNQPVSHQAGEKFPRNKVVREQRAATRSIFDKKCKKKISMMSDQEFKRICVLLNVPRIRGDWRCLAGELGYKVVDVQGFRLTLDPAAEMLCHWDAQEGHYAGTIVEKLRKIGRDDVADLFNEEINTIQCNCEQCGDIN